MPERSLGEITKYTDTDGILVTTRQRDPLDPIKLSSEDTILPQSLQRGLYPHWGILRRGSGETFLLTERPFSNIDRFFWQLPSKLIEFYLSGMQGGKVTVLDAGGGRDATTAKELAFRYPGAQVTSVDMVAIDEQSGNFTSRQGDICHLELPDSSVAIAYSHQVLPYMSIENNYARQIRIIEEIIRVLIAGGVGVIDYTNTPSIPEDVLSSINGKLDGVVMPKRKSYGGAFLAVVKSPVKPAIMEICARAPHSDLS